MKSTLISLIILAIGISLVGCKEEKEGFSSDELSYILGITKWTIQIPQDLEENEYLTFTWMNEDGSLQNEYALQLPKEIEEVNAYLWTDSGSPDFMKLRVLPRKEFTEKHHHKLSIPEGFHLRMVSGQFQMKENDTLLEVVGPENKTLKLTLTRRTI